MVVFEQVVAELTAKADALASAANLLKSFGWQRGQPWLQEVRVSANVPWEQADLTTKHPRAQWAKWGVSYPDGKPLPNDEMPASLLLPMGRPKFRSMTRAEWWPVLLLALVFATMNLTLYTSISRIGLALAVTLEFIGPLSVALFGSRSRWDILIAIAVGVGVYVLVLPNPSSDWLGIGLGLVAAGCWAAYIILNRTAGKRLPGLQAPAAAIAITSLLYLPSLVWLQQQGRLGGLPLLQAIAAGLVGAIVAELPTGAQAGLGARLLTSSYYGNTVAIWSALVMASVLGLVLTGAITLLEKAVLRRMRPAPSRSGA